MGQHQFKNLKVWQKAVDLAVDIYRITKTFPPEERYGLISQINRSVVSIASNVAEGAGRGSEKDFNNFLNVAYGSACETETQIIIAERLGFIDNNNAKDLNEKINELQKMLYGLKSSLNLSNK